MQRIRRTARSVHYTGTAIVFVESKHVLSKEIPENNDFADLNSAVVANGEEEAHAIISHLYKLNTQLRRERQLSLYHKVDPTVLWFVNTVGCQRCLILACFMQASAFTMSFSFDCYDNCIYESDPNRDVPVYDIHDITARQSIRYFDSKDWESEEILVEYNWLVA